MPSDFGCALWLCDGLARLLAYLPSDPILRLALYVALALGAATVLVMIQVLVLAELADLRTARRQRFDQNWRPLLAQCSLGEERLDAAPPARSQRLWFLLLWNRTQRQLRGAARERLNRLLEQLGMHAHVVRLLRSRSVRKRLIGLTCLRYLADPLDWPRVRPLLEARSPLVSLAAAQTLVAIDAARAMPEVLPLYLQRGDWAQPRLAALCQRAGPEALTGPLLETLHGAPEQARPRLLGSLAWADPRLSASWARAQLHAPSSSEGLQAALTCLGGLGDPRDHEYLLAAFEHADPDVRLSAIRALRRQAGSADAEPLRKLLGDSSWWVRQEAADALVNLPGMSGEALRQWLDELPDRYGRDALRRALAEHRHER